MRYSSHFWTVNTITRSSFSYTNKVAHFGLNVLLMKGMRCLFCCRIASTPMLEASVSISKDMVKLGRAKTRVVVVIAILTELKATVAS